jgi:hypothetical protein
MINDDIPPQAFTKQDEGDDLAFYAPPRLVAHIDESAIAALSGFYHHKLPTGARLLDLMSSWVSHLPDDRSYANVVGHGMNVEELAANRRLDQWFVQDLNAQPTLALQIRPLTLCCAASVCSIFNALSRCLLRCGERWYRTACLSRAIPTVVSPPKPSRSGAL